MNSKKYISLAIAAGFAASLLLAVPAFAQTTTGANQVPQHAGSRMGTDQERGEKGVFGTVSAVGSNSITVTSKTGPKGETTTTYTVDVTNAKVIKNGVASSVSGIAVGDNVTVQGTVNGSNLIATAVRDGFGMNMKGVFGTVSAVGSNTITVTSKAVSNGAVATTYTVDVTNAKVTKNGAASTISGIAVGDTVMVQGTVNGFSVTATSVRDGMGMNKDQAKNQTPIITGNGQPVIAGSVSAISNSTITVTNKSVTYSVDASSAKIVKGNVASLISNVAVGDNVIVQGTVNGTSVTASSVIDQGGSSSTVAKTNEGNIFVGIGNRIGDFFRHLFGF